MQDQHMDDTELKREERKAKKVMDMVEDENINRFPNRRERRAFAKRNKFFGKDGREVNAWQHANSRNVNRQTLRKQQDR